MWATKYCRSHGGRVHTLSCLWAKSCDAYLRRGGMQRADSAGASQPPSVRCCATHQSPNCGVEAASRGAGVSRAYPTEPRVGVGVVVFRAPPLQGQDPEILLVRRAKEPDKGRWCFPGGSLELGETLAACAAREVAEEAGLQLLGASAGHATHEAAVGGSSADGGTGGSSGGSGSVIDPGGRWDLRLMGPTPFAAVDVMRRAPDGRMQFHYVVVEVAAVCSDPNATPTAGDDADGVQWVRVSSMRCMADLTVRCDEMAEEAVRRFTAPHHAG